jgi:hypothetical protein
MMRDFTEFDWHDAEIEEICVNRMADRTEDILSLRVRWPDGSRNHVDFIGCYHANLQLNFGVMGAESVRCATVSHDDDLICDLRARWRALGVEIDALACFEIETNSTASIIKIYATGAELRQSG